MLPLVMSASDTARQGFVRIINRSFKDGTVIIRAIDDVGVEADTVTLSLPARQTRNFTSADLENGAPGKGLTGRAGNGRGNWRLILDANVDIEALAYIRAAGGFLTSIHDVASSQSMRWTVPTFNPARNTRQRTMLRIVNTSGIDTEVTIQGVDYRGNESSESVEFVLPADSARLYGANELENGHQDFEGALGAGSGKWQLFVDASRPVQVMSLMATPSGHLTNLSTAAADDTIRGGMGCDTLQGGSGDDVLDPGDHGSGGRCVDVVYGSGGNDEVIYTGSHGCQELRYNRLDIDAAVGIHAWIDGVEDPEESRISKPDGFDVITGVSDALTFDDGPFYEGGFGLIGTSRDDSFEVWIDEGQWMQIFGSAGDDSYIVNSDGGGFRLNYRHARNGGNVDLAEGHVSDDGFGDVDTLSGRPVSGRVEYGSWVEYGWELVGSDFSDVIRGSILDESFIGRGGDDRIDGGDGRDRLDFSTTGEHGTQFGSIEVDLGAGTASGSLVGPDNIHVEDFSYRLSNIEHVRGGPGNDTILGGNGPDRLDGGPGDDTIHPGGNFDVNNPDPYMPGDNPDDLGDVIVGSNGQDRIIYTDNGEDDFQMLDYSSLHTPIGISATIDGIANSATIDKGYGQDVIVDIANSVSGGFRPPHYNGGFGIYGTSEDDTFDIRLGDQRLGAPQSQWMVVGGGPGDDTYRIHSGWGVRIDYRRSPSGVHVDLSRGVADDGFGGTDTIMGRVWSVRGSNFSDVMIGTEGDDSFIGLGGNDRIEAGDGTDRLRFDRGCCADVGDIIVDVEYGEGDVRGTWNGQRFHTEFSGIDYIRGGPGDDAFRLAGDIRVEGRGGENMFFVDIEEPGLIVIDRFDMDGDDTVVLEDLDDIGLVLTKDELLAMAEQDGGSVRIDLSIHGGPTILLGQTHVGNLQRSDFLL